MAHIKLSQSEWVLLETEGIFGGRTQHQWYKYFQATNDKENLSTLLGFYRPPTSSDLPASRPTPRLPNRIWTIEDYYQAKDFYDARGLIFNPALEYGSPAAAHVIAQAQLRAHASMGHESSEVRTVEVRTVAPQAAMDSGNPGRDLVFVSYSHKDKKFEEDLLTHLKPYVRNGSISAWSDKQIQPGSRWYREIQMAIASAKVAVLLVSKDFLASDFIHHHELGPLLREAKAGGVTLLWVLIRACSFHESPIGEIQAAYPPDKPLAEMKAERDRAWVAVCMEVKKAVAASQGSQQAIPTPDSTSPATP